MAQRMFPSLRCTCRPALSRPSALLARPSAATFSPLHPLPQPSLPSRLPSPFRAYSTPSPPPPPSSTPPPSPPGSGSGPNPDPFRAQREAYTRARNEQYARRNRSLLLYSASTIILVTTVSYLAVPLYRVFCSATGYGGTPQTDSARFSADRLVPAADDDRRVRVSFNADSSDSLPWSFTPQQKEVRVLPGETSLAFYTAVNHSDEDIIGIATYNVTPNNIAPYFAKVECFCFEEQRILAGEEVDLPILFFIDRDFLEDPLMKDVREVTLSYTFFRARRDSYGNLVPSEGPLAVAGSVPAV